MKSETGQVHVVRYATSVQDGKDIAQPIRMVRRNAPFRPSFIQRL